LIYNGYVLDFHGFNDILYEIFQMVFRLYRLTNSKKLEIIYFRHSPRKAGIQETQPLMDSRFRGNDGFGDFL